MSRAILFAMVVAVVVCYASCVPAPSKSRCPLPGQVWKQCATPCEGMCPNTVSHLSPKACAVRNCKGRCVCKEGYFLTKNEAGVGDGCVFEAAC